MTTEYTPPADNVEDVAATETISVPAPPLTRVIRIAKGSSKEATDYMARAGTFEALCESFSKPNPATKDKGNLPCWCAGHLEGRRTKANAKGADLLTVEYDQHEWVTHPTEIDPKTNKPKRVKVLLPEERRTQMSAALSRWEGIDRFLVTSYSHAPEIPRFRVILLLSRTVTPDEFDRLIHWAFRKLEDAGDTIDESCGDICRPWFVPCIPPSGHFYHERVEGKPLDVDEILKSLPAPTPKKTDAGISLDSRLGERIEEIKSRIDFEDLLRDDKISFEIKGSRRYYNLRNERTPSAVYYDDDGHIYDFGTCEVWDAISYYRDRHAGSDFRKAIDDLSERAGLEPFIWKNARRPRVIDPFPLIAALPDALPTTGRSALLAPVYRAIATMPEDDHRPAVDALLARFSGKCATKLDRKTIEKGIKEALESFDTQNEQEEESDTPYEIKDGSLCHVGTMDGIPFSRPLINGDIRIAAAVNADGQGRFTLRATRKDGTVLPTFEIPKKDFAKMEWLIPFTGLIPAPGRATMDRIRHAIQLLSGDYPVTNSFSEFGWHEVDGKWIFCHAGGYIGEALTAINVDFPQDLFGKYDMSFPELHPSTVKFRGGLEKAKLKETQDAIAYRIHGFLRTDGEQLAPAKIVYPLFASAVHAPVIDVLSDRIAVSIIGPTAAYKSSLAQEYLRFFGSGWGRGKNFPGNFEGRPGGTELVLNKANDLLMVVDDAFPKGRDGDRQLEKAKMIVHNYANNAAPARATQTMGFRKSYPAQCVLWTTAEMDITPAQSGVSTSNRSFKIEFNRGDISARQLENIQNQPHPHIGMRAYLEWLITHPEWRVNLPRRHAEVLSDFRKEHGIHGRQQEVLASLYCATELYLRFAVEFEAITQAHMDQYLVTMKDALLEAAREQTEITQAHASPAQTFLRCIHSMLVSGRARLQLPEHILSPQPGVVDIGWAEKNERFVWILPEAALQLWEANNTEGAVIPKPREMFQHLQLELKATPPPPSEKGRTATKKSGLGGCSPRIWEIPIEHFEGVAIPDREAKPSTESVDPAPAKKTNEDMASYLDPLVARVKPIDQESVRLIPLDTDLQEVEYAVGYSEFRTRYAVENDIVPMIKQTDGTYLPLPRVTRH